MIACTQLPLARLPGCGVLRRRRQRKDAIAEATQKRGTNHEGIHSKWPVAFT